MVKKLGLGLAAMGFWASCSNESSIVARAGDHTLTAGEFAELVGPARPIPLDEESLYGVARRWIEYSIFADSTAHGVDFLDSALMMEVKWPEVRRAIVDSFRLTLLEESVAIDSADALALYNGGELRSISHVLIKTNPEDPVGPRRLAESIRARLVAGETWAAANESNQDELSKSHGGSIGIISRNATVPPFEKAAFALNPGEISAVVPSEFGFHVIFRPPFDEVLGEFFDYLRRQSAQAFDSTYKVELRMRRDLAFPDGAIELARAAMDDPNTAVRDRSVLATFDTGSFTIREFARWMFQVLPNRFQREVRSASEERVEAFIADIVLQELMYEEALKVGITLPEGEYSRIADMHDEEVFLVRLATGFFIDSLAVLPGRVEDRMEAAQGLLNDYLTVALRLVPRFRAVPAFLADTLLAGADWTINRNRMATVITLAQPARDSMLAAPPGPVIPDPGR